MNGISLTHTIAVVDLTRAKSEATNIDEPNGNARERRNDGEIEERGSGRGVNG